MKRNNRFTIVLIGVLVASFACIGQEWTRFRGPNGSGISEAKGIPTKITESDLKWKFGIPGSGHSSPVLWGERLFITCTGDKSGGISVICLGAKDGKLLWQRDFPLAPFTRHQYNSFASATPTADGQHLYVVWNEPDHYMLTALDHAGKTVWQRDFGSYVSQHGCGASPILWKDKLILPNSQDEPKFVEGPMPDARHGKSSIIAVEASTGKTLWQIPRESTVVSYSTPCVFAPKDGKPSIIFNSQSHGISALDPDNGKVLWEYGGVFNRRSVSSPIIADELILGSCGSGAGGNVVSAIRAGDAGNGRKPELVYQVKKSASYVPTGIARGELLWLWSDAGVVSCLNAKTGEVHYQERVGGNFFGSPIWAEGRLFSVSKTGELVVVDAADKFNVLHRYDLKEGCESTVAAALDRLFVRTEKHVWCFGAPNLATPP